MVVQADGVSLAAECRQRTCMETIWDPQSCQCSSGEKSSCGPGERLYEDIFGAGVCGCREGHDLLPQTGECRQVETEHNNTSRVFDIIPSTGPNNIQNMNRVTQQTCVLDAKGRCRKKITINRAGTDESQSKSEEF